MKQEAFLALDYGASSGRAYLGWLEGSPPLLRMREIHRFPNGAVEIHGRKYWDVFRLYGETVTALQKAARQADLAGVGIDTWAHDYALLNEEGDILGPVYHYRDKRSQGMQAKAFQRIPKEEVYRRTGAQFLPHNTLYQMLGDPPPEKASRLLMLPDLLAYWLGGKPVCEYTNTTTTQMNRAGSPGWDQELIERMGLPVSLFPEIVQPGACLGQISGVAAALTGVQAPLYAVATHDTASAVAALPLHRDEPCWYVSMGTWSLVGTETAAPVIAKDSFRWELANEGGVENRNRLLKNVAGTWLLENLISAWRRRGLQVSMDALMEEVRWAKPFQCFIDPNDPDFYAPQDMDAAVRGFLEKTGQEIPATRGGLARCVMESTAFKYRSVILEKLVPLTAYHKNLFLMGGGTHNRTMCRFTSSALDMPASVACPESTVAGNLLVQMMGAGRLKNLQDARDVMRRSFPLGRYEPQEHSRWKKAYERFQKYETTL